MTNPIDITAENLIKKSVDTSRVNPEQSADKLLANTIKQLFGDMDPDKVCLAAIEQSVQAKLESIRRDSMAKQSEFEHIGQLDLEGFSVDEHKIPKAMKTRSVAEVDDWMQSRAQIELENAEELRKAYEAQQNKANRFQQWAYATKTVRIAVERMGLDPTVISYEQAINKAKTANPSNQALLSPKTKQPMRPMRPTDGDLPNAPY